MGARGPQPKLTDRDMELLIDLYRTRCMTSRQIRESVFKSTPRYARDRLNILKERGFITATPYKPSQYDSTNSFEFQIFDSVYELTERGIRAVERHFGEEILAGEGTRIKVATAAVSRYLEVAEVYTYTKTKIEWVPHFAMRHRIGAKDMTIGCLSSVIHDNEMTLLYGVHDNPSLKTLSIIPQQIKRALFYNLNRHVLLCPNQNTVEVATEYFQGKTLEGTLHIITYKQARDDLPGLKNTFNEVLISKIQALYGHSPIYKASGKHPLAFQSMIEHRKGKLAYLVDLSTGNQNLLQELRKYNESQYHDHGKWNQSKRGVWVMVRNLEQLAHVTPYLDDHPHVRITIRESKEPQWFGMDSGKWIEIPFQQGGTA